MLTQILLFAVLGTALGGHSPHADELGDIFRAARYSNDIEEDARLDGPGLIVKYGYPFERHQVQTSDGYVLEIHRIPHGRVNADSSADRPVVFVMHGLLSSSADWVLMGPDKGLGYILADAGYDVWMGNARGNYYSRRHSTLNPSRGDFWLFSWHEIGHIDLAAMIDHTLRFTGKSKLHYIGHSQGTTSFFVLTSTMPEYNSKIISMQALAPIAFMNNLFSPLVRVIAPFAGVFDAAIDFLGMNEFLPNTQLMTIMGGSLCRDTSIVQFICSNTLFLLGGYNVDQFNVTMLPVIMGHTPAGASSKQLIHYAQGINEGQFRQFSYSRLKNLLTYGSFNPPNYRLDRITAPIALHYSDNDWLADVGDVDRLFRQLPNVIGKFRIPDKEFTHLDFLWAVNADTLVYQRAINLMKQFN